MNTHRQTAHLYRKYFARHRPFSRLRGRVTWQPCYKMTRLFKAIGAME